jgi:phosphopantetheinyl transferase
MRLHAGAVHIWQADLDAVSVQLERLLSQRERVRAARIVREPARRRWMAARGVLRTLLGEYLERDPRSLRFAEEPRGKPTLETSGESRLHFSLAHSGGLAVCALSRDCAVGVDVELTIRHPGAHAYSRDFLRAWVTHEAEIKRVGVGGRSRPTPDRATRSSSKPWIAELHLGPEAVGAVALETTPVDFRVYPIDFRSYGSILPAGTSTPAINESNVSK